MARRRTLILDSLEPREMLSITPLINSPGWVHTTVIGGGNTSVPASTSSLTFDPTTGLYYNNNLGGSGITTDVAPPRVNELTRRNFKATFSGKVQEQPPRLLDQSHQFYILAPGTSSAFLHGTAQIRYYTPNPHQISFIDPMTGQAVVETATATSGTISMSDRSTQSGAVILANLTGSPADEDKFGRPTHLTLALNGGGGSGGVYASSVGSGTVDIAYHGNRATITVHASIFLSGVGNQLDIFQSNTHH